MAREHGPWRINGTRRVYRNALIEVNEDEVTRPDGRPGTYATVRMKDGVNVLAVDEGGNAFFAQEFRYALGRINVETVAGGIDEGEAPEAAARRELREELGIEAEEFVELGTLYQATSIINSASALFLARRLSFTEKEPDASEKIEVVKMPLAEAVARALNGEITHSNTCVLVLRAHAYLNRNL